MDTKRDRDALKALLAHITSMRFAAKLEGRQSRSRVRTAKTSLYNNLVTFKDINKTSLTVRNDMTANQQHQYHQKLTTKRKFNAMKVVAHGRGTPLKCKQFPEATLLLEGVFEESGMEGHPRLTDDILYRARNNAITMKQASEVLLAAAPDNFYISLSSCFNYTQNYKAGTAQAKRHHDSMNVNACISLHAPPRVGVEKPSPNLHWSSSNINMIIAGNDSSGTLVKQSFGVSTNNKNLFGQAQIARASTTFIDRRSYYQSVDTAINMF